MENVTTAVRREAGFTLIELMVVIAIVAILLAIALPAFQNQIIRGHRAAAKSEMMDIANRQTQFLLSNRAYADKATLTASGYQPPDDVANHYDFDITLDLLSTVPFYTLTFTPKGSQAVDGALSLDSEGVKLPADKWNR